MSILKEFKEFAVKGNAIDLAVGVVVGAAFSKITSSLVADVLMPPLGLLLGNIDFSDFGLVLKAGSDGAAPVMLAYGKFIQTVIEFVIIAFAVFLLVKMINRLKRQNPEQAKPASPTEVALLTEIRDLLKNK